MLPGPPRKAATTPGTQTRLCRATGDSSGVAKQQRPTDSDDGAGFWFAANSKQRLFVQPMTRSSKLGSTDGQADRRTRNTHVRHGPSSITGTALHGHLYELSDFGTFAATRISREHQQHEYVTRSMKKPTVASLVRNLVSSLVQIPVPAADATGGYVDVPEEAL